MKNTVKFNRMKEKAEESKLAKTESRKSPEELVARLLQGNAAGMDQL